MTGVITDKVSGQQQEEEGGGAAKWKTRSQHAPHGRSKSE
jgi:hypothetical protein